MINITYKDGEGNKWHKPLKEWVESMLKNPVVMGIARKSEVRANAVERNNRVQFELVLEYFSGGQFVVDTFTRKREIVE